MSESLCPKCGASNRNTARFCADCGAPLLSNLPPRTGEQPVVNEPSGLVGTVLQGRYRIDAELGRGGFGAVYRAWDANLNKWCAVKENLDTLPEAQRQFKREAMVLANLSHPNLPRVTDHFSITGQGQYLVMDFVEGEDLASLVYRQGAVDPAQALEWALQVTEALVYLHSQEPPVFHRDIKPANIRLTPKGRAMLVDFGLVKVSALHSKTTMGARAITPGYAPPEQYGQGQTSARTDIYALGATLYNLLTGLEPPESVMRLTSIKIQPVHQINPNIPAPVGLVVERAMALEPTQRYQSAEEFKAALQNLIRPLPQAAVPAAVKAEEASRTRIAEKPQPPSSRPMTPPPAQKQSKKLPVVAIGIGALVIVGLCAAILFAVWAIGKRVVANEEPTPVASRTSAKLANSPSQTPAAATKTPKVTSTPSIKATQTAQAAASATTRAKLTSTAQAWVKATDQALVNYLATLTANKQIIFGPRDGRLVHDSDDYIEASPSTAGVRNFIAEVRFDNPYAASENSWAYGLIFRSEGGNKQFRLLLTYKKEWYLSFHTGSGGGTAVGDGNIPGLNVDSGGSNVLRLIAVDDQGWLYVNDVFIAELDLSKRYIGSVYAYIQWEKTGEITSYEDFTVWSIR